MCGFEVDLQRSPPFVMDSWYGLRGVRHPLWLDRPTTPEFWLSRVDAIELVRVLSLLRWNDKGRDGLLQWADNITVSRLLPLNDSDTQLFTSVDRSTTRSSDTPFSPRRCLKSPKTCPMAPPRSEPL